MPTLTRVALPSPAELITDVLGLLLNYFFLLTLKFTTREGNPFKQRQKNKTVLNIDVLTTKLWGSWQEQATCPRTPTTSKQIVELLHCLLT